MVIFINSVLLGLALFLFFRYFIRRNTLWKNNKHIPVIKSNSILHHFLSDNKPIQDLQIERLKKYGRIYGYYEGRKSVLVISEPTLLKQILVKDFKYFPIRRKTDKLHLLPALMLDNLPFDKWRKIRFTISPTFTAVKLKEIMDIVTECAKTLVKNFEAYKNADSSVEISRLFKAFTMNIIARLLFSMKLDSHNDPDNVLVKTGKEIFDHSSWFKLWLFDITENVLGGWRYQIFGISKKLQFFERLSLPLIRNRKLKIEFANDILQLLIDASTQSEKDKKYEEDFKGTAKEFKKKTKIINGKLNDDLTDQELTAQCLMFLLAGFHGPASTLTFTTYLLALHQDVQNKVYEEIKSIWERSSAPNFPSYEDLQDMKYLDNVISESLRLYPTSVFVDRIAAVDYDGLKDTLGITLPKGTVIAVPICALHRDPDFFPEPHKFDPTRFNEDNREKFVPYSYMPFGVGPRNCVAMRMGLLEVKATLVHLLCKFHIQKCPETKVPLEFHNGRNLMHFNSLLPKDVRIKVVPRNNPIVKT